MDEFEGAKNPKKRRTITFQQKIEIIQKYENGERLAAIGRCFGLSRSTINTIVKDKERIKMHIKDGIDLQQISATRARSIIMEQMEQRLKIWLDSHNQNNVPLTLSIIQRKAKQIHADLINTMGQSSADPEVFNASWGWFRRFKIRSNLNNMKIKGEVASDDSNAANDFSAKLKNIIEEGGYTPQQIFNVDETTLFWKKIPINALSTEEKHTLMLLLGANASGDFKIKPMVVYHNENPIALRGITKSSLPVIWRSNYSASITAELFQDWFANYFVPSVHNYCAENNLDFKILLVLDNAPTHPTHLNESYPNVKVVYLPPNTSDILQPMEQTVIATFKKYYLATIINSLSENQEISISSFWKDYNISSAIQNIAKCWAEIKQNTINTAWKNLCPQYVFNNENLEECQNKIIEQIIEMSQKLELNMNIEDANDLLETHMEELTTNDLLDLQEQMKIEIDDEIPNVDTIIPEMDFKSISDILNKVENVIEVIKNSDPDIERRLSVINSLRNSTACYQQLYQINKES